MIRVRVDDFPHTKDGEKGKHSLAAYREFHRVLSECIGGRRYVLGVIPGRCSVDDVLFLRNETDVSIGMHGINHDEEKLDIYRNEFPPFYSEQQVGRLLIEASHALEVGVCREVRLYMPPRNMIDRRTVDVLMDCGFYGYTAGPETHAAFLYHPDLVVFPSIPPFEYGRTDELLQREAHVHLRQFKGDVILTLHWTWETNIGLEHMRKFFAEIPKELFADFDA